MYGIAHSMQFVLLLKSAAVGYLDGLFYIVFVLLRKIGLNGTVHVIVQDIIFCILSAVLFFLFVLDVNFGMIRAYMLAAFFIGAFISYLFPWRSYLFRKKNKKN